MINIIQIEDKVSCLPGYESLDTKEIAKRKTKMFVRKSSNELRLEIQRKRKIRKIWDGKTGDLKKI